MRFSKYIVVTFLFATFCGYLYLIWYVWYQYEDRVAFHWFNDATEWGGMDKMGHAFSAFVLVTSLHLLCKTLEQLSDKAILLSGMLSFLVMAAIEVFDGFCVGYGASLFDIVANSLGILYGYAYVRSNLLGPIKISFVTSAYAVLRPDLLGSNIFSQFLKDYNGLTFWFCVSPNRWVGWWPSWLTIALGYGVDGYLGGHDNLWNQADKLIDYSHVPRMQSLCLSIDVDWRHVPQSWLQKPYQKAVLQFLNYVKLPIPFAELICF